MSDVNFEAREHRFPHNTPHTKEAYFVRDMFYKHFPQQSAAESVPGGSVGS